MRCTRTHTHTHARSSPTAHDEVGVENAQRRLVGALLVVDGSRDDEAEGDAGDALQYDQYDHQDQGAFVGHLKEEEKHGTTINKKEKMDFKTGINN